MNIDTAYSFIKDLANKSQRGFIPSAKFNRYAERAQIEVFMQRYGNPHNYRAGYPVAAMGYGQSQKIHDDLRPFIRPGILNLDAHGQAWYPKDYVHLSSLNYQLTDKEEHRKVPVKVIGDDVLAYRLSSKLVQPTLEHPICVLYENYLQFYPEQMNGVNIVYLRQPTPPKWAYTLVSNREVYDAGNSVDWEFPDEVHNELCIKVLSYIGIRLREEELIQYAELKNKQGI